MIERVLVPVDGSDCATRAARVGVQVAQAYGATVDVLHVAEKSMFGSENGEAAASADERGTEILEETVRATDDVNVGTETNLREGRPQQVIPEYARERDADLIVVGRQGTSGLDERLLGSVTERVLCHADRPVLVVPWAGGREADVDLERVLVTTDGSDAAERAAPFGRDIAERYGAALDLLTVVDLRTEPGLISAGGLSEAEIERFEQEGRERIDRLAESLGSVDVPVRRSVERGVPYEEIQDYVEDNDIDLVVMATRNQSIVGQRLGSVTDRVLRLVDVPVLAVKDSADES